MATKLLLQLEDGRAVTARAEAWIQAIIAVLPAEFRGPVFELAEKYDREQTQLYTPPPGPSYHLADSLKNGV